LKIRRGGGGVRDDFARVRAQGKWNIGAVLEWAQGGKGGDANGYRAGFIELVRKAQKLSKS
jgi:hypothetical protein